MKSTYDSSQGTLHGVSLDVTGNVVTRTESPEDMSSILYTTEEPRR